MPFYRSADALSSALGATFRRIEQESPDHLNGLKEMMASRMAIRLKCTGPSAEITLDGRSRPFRASYGTSGPLPSSRPYATLRANLNVELEADTMHHILPDELSIMQAVADDKIRVLGPVWKSKVLIDLIQGARAYYPEVLREPGLI
jgi:hypothetical protein